MRCVLAVTAKEIPALGFSWLVLFTLLTVLLVSAFVFHWQVQRWTTHRGWRALLDFARATGFTLSNQRRDAPAPFERLGGATITTCLESKTTRVFQLETTAGGAVETPRWHALVRQLETAWTPTGLRPVINRASLLDLFSLSSFPGMGEVERFMLFGVASTAARHLSQSQARALLPPDIGLLLHGRHLVLDFSSRPFDATEFRRMLAVADQVVAHLPVIG